MNLGPDLGSLICFVDNVGTSPVEAFSPCPFSECGRRQFIGRLSNDFPCLGGTDAMLDR